MAPRLYFPLLISSLLFLWVLVKTWKQYRTESARSKLPPGPWKLPIVGHLHHLLGLPHHCLRDLARNHGSLMHLQLGRISTVIVSSAEVAKQVMKTNDLLFVDRFVIFSAKIMTYKCKDMIFAPYGDYWRQMRKICILELLSAKRVQSFWSLRNEEVSNLLQSISFMAGSKVNISERFYSLTGDIISRAAFGKKCKDNPSFMLAMQEAIKTGGGFDIADLFPSLKFLHMLNGTKSKLERIHCKVDKILNDIIEEHKEHWKETNTVKDDVEDLVDVLLRLQESGDLDFPITTENIKAVILDIFTAGSDTTSTALEWALSEMVRHPRVMKKAQEEIRRVFNGKNEVHQKDLDELNYLKSVIKEALRLHPPAPLIPPRECKETCQIDEYEIPIKTKVIINVWAIGRDPKHWKDAETFNPERFDVISTDYKGNSFEYIPFGAGRRMCPGILFAMANIELPLAQLLYHFDWNLPNGMIPEELDMTEEFGATVRRKPDLYLIPTPYCPEIEMVN
ncbi:hypothetical protein Scep_012447 [Stephania cephalantha]|uniref:Cytochrome P450 n=1 Tax=Stephania cephalantha TaxID=152367 RepID=A0AAP0JF63_9MAGN